MDKSQISLIMYAFLVAGFGGQYLIGRCCASAQPVLFIPFMWLFAVGFLIIKGSDSVSDYLVAAAGFFLLFLVWDRGRRKAKKKKD